VRTQRIALAAPAAASASNKMRWPAQGRIVSGFGRRIDGTHNDGINISVPLGTEVHAAESGVVAYAGSELKGYGNLVLLRHDNGWVTAYAHNDQLTVKRGDKVQRGQIIARAGRTGSVDQPQLHFELRQGSKPVDPVPFLARL
jgi:murein DD-endopeptidase MepM/ murein hydrolase activator NlpD